MSRFQVSIRDLLLLAALVALVLSYVNNLRRMRTAEAELARLREEVGYLESGEENEIAAVRIASEEPLTWQTRVRIPKGKPYRVAYSALWRESTAAPEWFSAQPVPAGESIDYEVRGLQVALVTFWEISLVT